VAYTVTNVVNGSELYGYVVAMCVGRGNAAGLGMSACGRRVGITAQADE